MNKRRDEDYEIESVTAALVVLKALAADGFNAVPIKIIAGRTELSPNRVFRILQTLKLSGFVRAVPVERWTVGPEILRFSKQYAELVREAMLEKSK